MLTRIASLVDFGVNGNAIEFLGQGWSGQEARHRWTVSDRSVLVLNAPEAPCGYFLEIDWMPALASPQVVGQSVAIAVNGEPVYRSMIARNCIVAFRCPPPEPLCSKVEPASGQQMPSALKITDSCVYRPSMAR